MEIIMKLFNKVDCLNYAFTLKLCVLCIFVVNLTSCSKNLSAKEELKEMLSEESPYTKVVLRNGFKIKSTYLPMRYFYLRERSNIVDSLFTPEKDAEINEKINKYYSNGIYFIVNLSLENNEQDILNATSRHFGEWSENLQKFLFKMNDFIYLETAQTKEIKLSVYDFQRTFGYTKDRSMILSFPKKFNDKEIISDESEFVRMHFKEWGWNIGRSSVKWNISDLEN
jgi:hypothetical protein